MKMLYANGDSFVFGMECIANGSRVEENKEFSFAKHVTVGLGCETYVNNAYNGATNEFIFRSTIFDLLELEAAGILPDEIFILIGWTSSFRIEVDASHWIGNIPNWDSSEVIKDPLTTAEYRDYGTFFLNPTANHIIKNNNGKQYNIGDSVVPFCAEFLWTDDLQMPQLESKILALHEFLKSKGYKHLFLNTCNTGTFKKVDTANKNFYNLNNESFYQWAKTNFKNEIRSENHFSPVPHSAYGENVLQYIIKNIL